MEDKEELYGKYLLKGAKLLLVLGCIILFVLFMYSDDKPVKMNLRIIEEQGENLLCEGTVYASTDMEYILEVKKDMSYYKVISKGDIDETDLAKHMLPINSDLFENENDFWEFVKDKNIKGIPKDFEINTSKTKYLSKDKIALVGVEESKNVGWNDRQYVIYTFDFKTNKLENINLKSPYKVAKNKRYPYIEVFEDNSKDSISFIWGDYEKARELIGDSYSLKKFVKNGEFVKLDASGRIFLKSKEQQEMLAEIIDSHNWGILIGSDESIYIGGSDSNIDGNYIFKLGNKWNRLEYINIIEKKKN